MTAKLRIHALPLVKMRFPKGIYTYMIDMCEIIDAYFYTWYIEGAKERILVDVGCSADIMAQAGFQGETVASPVEALKTVGVSPEEIDLVICTHLHVDHIAFGYLYKRAKFIVQKEELEAALNPHPAQRLLYPDKEILKDINFQTINGDTKLTEGVSVLFTPGHTPGTQSVAINTEKGMALISGMCIIKENLDPPEMIKSVMPVITPAIHLDAREAFDSLLRIKHEADIVIPSHDPEFALQNTIP